MALTETRLNPEVDIEINDSIKTIILDENHPSAFNSIPTDKQIKKFRIKFSRPSVHCFSNFREPSIVLESPNDIDSNCFIVADDEKITRMSTIKILKRNDQKLFKIQ